MKSKKQNILNRFRLTQTFSQNIRKIRLLYKKMRIKRALNNRPVRIDILISILSLTIAFASFRISVIQNKVAKLENDPIFIEEVSYKTDYVPVYCDERHGYLKDNGDIIFVTSEKFEYKTIGAAHPNETYTLQVLKGTANDLKFTANKYLTFSFYRYGNYDYCDFFHKTFLLATPYTSEFISSLSTWDKACIGLPFPSELYLHELCRDIKHSQDLIIDDSLWQVDVSADIVFNVEYVDYCGKRKNVQYQGFCPKGSTLAYEKYNVNTPPEKIIESYFIYPVEIPLKYDSILVIPYLDDYSEWMNLVIKDMLISYLNK